MPDAPAASCAKRVARPHTSIHSGGTGKPGNPARNGVTTYTVLSSGRCSLRPLSDRIWFVRPGWADEPPQDLTPASGAGPHGFVVRFDIVRPARPSKAHRLTIQCAPCPANGDHARHRRVHRISSRVRDDRDTPLVWNETNEAIGCFEQKRNRNISRDGAGRPRNTLGHRPQSRRGALIGASLSAKNGLLYPLSKRLALLRSLSPEAKLLLRFGGRGQSEASLR